MAHTLPPSLPLLGGSPTRLACALLVGGTLLGAPVADAVAAPTALTAPLEGISGVVRDAKGNPLPGVTVLIKGTKTGTASAADGTFHLNLPTGKETLIFSYIGYKAKEVAVNGQATIEVALEDDNAALDEVVVVGYGTQTKAHLTGSVASVDMRNVQALPVGSLSAVIQGQLPGVSVAGGTSRPGDPAIITVRNPSLLSKDGGTTQPLYVIDNVVRTADDFNILDQSEVAAISVLKDAAAAIYGARANQGVVVITTKRGQVGAPKFSYSGSVGQTTAAMLPKMMNAYDQALYLNDLNYAGGKTYTDASIYTADELKYFSDGANTTDWLRTAWKPAILTRHALNMSGGSDRVTYFAGVSYQYQNANFDNINNGKWTYRASTDVQVARGLKASLSLSGSMSDKRMYYLKQGGENVENDMKSLLYTPQWAPPYIDGNPVQLSTASNTNTIDAFNFFAVQNSDNYTNTRYNGLNLTANLSYDLPFIKGLQVRALYSRTLDNTFGKQYGTKYNVYQYSMLGDHKHIYGGTVVASPQFNNGDRVRINPSYFDSYQLNGYLTYNRGFGKHQISALTFFEQSETKTDLVAAMAEGVIVGGLDNMNYATGTQTTSETQTESGLLSYAGRINYSYADKYLLEIAARYDGSTNFAPKYRWGFFPSISAGWVISEERFFHNKNFVNFLKLRASVGMLGGDATRAYNWQTSYALQTGKAAVFGGNGDRGLVIVPNNAMANPYIRWDDDTKYNVGLDAQFLNGRLNLGVDAFYDHRYNMLTQLTGSAPLIIGATLPSENFSTVDGFGYEISLGYNQRVNADLSFRVNTFFTWSDNKQVLVDVSKGNIGTYLDPTGMSSDQGVFGYHYQGMFRSSTDIDNFFAANPQLDRNKYTILGLKPQPGMLYYQDVRGPKQADGSYAAPDGIITDADQDYLTPKSSNHYSIGFNPSITYKSLTVSATMGASFGGQAVVESTARAQGTATSNRPQFWADHWSPDNPNAAMPSPYYKDQYNVVSEFWFRRAFTAGIRNATVSYNLPVGMASKMHMSGLNVFFVATNLANFFNPYDYKTYSGSYDAYPTLRSLSLGLNVSL